MTQKYLHIPKHMYDGDEGNIGIILDDLKDVDELIGFLDEDEIELYKIDLDKPVKVSVNYDAMYKVEVLKNEDEDVKVDGSEEEG